MKKGDVVTLEGSGETITLVRPIGKKDETGQFWKVKDENGFDDIRLLRERQTNNQSSTKGDKQ